MGYQYDGSETEQKGISLLLHVFITRLLSLIALNALFLLCCLPIATIPAAYAALMKGVRLLLGEAEAPLLRAFFAGFRSEFFKTLAAGWILLLLFAGSLYGMLFYLSVDTEAALPLAIFCGLLSVYLYTAAVYLFSMLAQVRLPFSKLLKNAFLLVFVKPLRGIGASVISLGILAACAWMFPQSLPVYSLIAFSLSALIACFGMRETVEKYIIKRG